MNVLIASGWVCETVIFFLVTLFLTIHVVRGVAGEGGGGGGGGQGSRSSEALQELMHMHRHVKPCPF